VTVKLLLRNLLVVVLILAAPCLSAQAGFRLGIGIGIPIGPAPCYYGYPYYAPYPVYAAPVVVQQPVYQVAPTAPAAVSAAPAQPAPAPVSPQAAALSSPVPSTIQLAGREDGGEIALQQLQSADERTRTAAALQLGRLRAFRSVDTLGRTLRSDPSPAVRDAAARALGLIGSSSALPALDEAAQADDNRDVRRSASFASEVIRATAPR
jgi:hypothetical protein